MTACVRLTVSLVCERLVVLLLLLTLGTQVRAGFKVAYLYTDDDVADPNNPNAPANTIARLQNTWTNIVSQLWNQATEQAIYSPVISMLRQAGCSSTDASLASYYLQTFDGADEPMYSWTLRVSSQNPPTFSTLLQAYDDLTRNGSEILAGSNLWMAQWFAKKFDQDNAHAYVYDIPQSLLARLMAGVVQYLLVSIPQKNIMLANASSFFTLIPSTSQQLTGEPGSSYYYSEAEAYVDEYNKNFYAGHAGQPNTYYYNGYEYSTDYFYSQSYAQPPQAPDITGSTGGGSTFYLLNASVTILYDDTADLVLIASLLRMLKSSDVPQLYGASVFHIPANFTSLANFTTYVQLLTSNAPLLYLCFVSAETGSTLATAIDETSNFVPLRYDQVFEFANFSQSTWLFWNVSNALGGRLSASPYLLHMEPKSFLPITSTQTGWQSLCPSMNITTYQQGVEPPYAYSQFCECSFITWLAATTLWHRINADCGTTLTARASMQTLPSEVKIFTPTSGSLTYTQLQLFQGFGQFATQFGLVDNRNGMSLTNNASAGYTRTCRYSPIRNGTNAILRALGKQLFPQSTNCYDIITMNMPPYFFQSATVAPFGINMELADALSSLLGFSYTITPTNQLSVDVTLKGSIPYLMINELFDFAIAPLLVDTAERQWKSFRFTIPYMQVRYTVLTPNTSSNVSQQSTTSQIIFAAYSPFEGTLWILIGCTAFAVFIMLAIQDSLVPNRISFSIKSWPRTLHYVFARLVLGVSGTNPDTFPSQILIIFWCLCSLVIIFSYLANYSAMIISSGVNNTWSYPQQLLSSGQAYSTVNGSDTLLFFQHSTLPAYQMMYAIMQRNLQSNLASAVQNALVNSVSLIFHEPTNVFLGNMYCLQSSAPFADNDLVLAIPRAQDLFDPVVNEVNLNAALRQLQVTGVLSNITASFWLRNPYTASNNIFNINDTISPYACKGTTQPLYAISQALNENDAPVMLENLLGPIAILLGTIVFTLLLSSLTRISRIIQYKHTEVIRLKREKMIARVRQDITKAVQVLLGHRDHDKKLRDPKAKLEEEAEQAARKDIVSILKKQKLDEKSEKVSETPQSKSASFVQHALLITYEPDAVPEVPTTKGAKGQSQSLVTVDVEMDHKRKRLHDLGMNDKGEDKHPKSSKKE